MRNENNDKLGENAALFAGIGVGVAFMGAPGIVAIAVFAVLGACVGYVRRGDS